MHEVVERVAPRDDRNPLRDPRRAHRRDRLRPDLLVVRRHELPADARSESGQHPGLEVGGRLRLALVEVCLDQAGQRLLGEVVGQVVEVVLERIGHERAVDVDVRRAVVLFEIVAHHVGEKAVELAVVREDDVPAAVPREAV